MTMTALISILLIHIILILVGLVVLEENSVFGHAQNKDITTASAGAAA